ncbi:MAG: hypothetical protein AVDCRST_MAG77-340 [uncultured Chloroflexi bacterium]|uniref:Uncharacterized protein n=1 Tax=uncultured Chloroflexota bacterium TaxID=166587 RepID=A0A6J4HAQ3_9CHLR|nr:MAG: hypothetical protein AVDCRST_MAG77-340 [uncultured Chloroflexota bacterium]
MCGGAAGGWPPPSCRQEFATLLGAGVAVGVCARRFVGEPRWRCRRAPTGRVGRRACGELTPLPARPAPPSGVVSDASSNVATSSPGTTTPRAAHSHSSSSPRLPDVVNAAVAPCARSASTNAPPPTPPSVRCLHSTTSSGAASNPPRPARRGSQPVPQHLRRPVRLHHGGHAPPAGRHQVRSRQVRPPPVVHRGVRQRVPRQRVPRQRVEKNQGLSLCVPRPSSHARAASDVRRASPSKDLPMSVPARKAARVSSGGTAKRTRGERARQRAYRRSGRSAGDPGWTGRVYFHLVVVFGGDTARSLPYALALVVAWQALSTTRKREP